MQKLLVFSHKLRVYVIATLGSNLKVLFFCDKCVSRNDDPQKAKALKEAIQWGLTEVQKYANELGYVPLPPQVVQKASAAVNQITP